MTAITILIISTLSSLSGGMLTVLFCYNRKIASGGNDWFANPLFSAALVLLVGGVGFYFPSTVLSQQFLESEIVQTEKDGEGDRTSQPVVDAVSLEKQR